MQEYVTNLSHLFGAWNQIKQSSCQFEGPKLSSDDLAKSCNIYMNPKANIYYIMYWQNNSSPKKQMLCQSVVSGTAL